MAEIVRDLEYLTSLPDTDHWFCPRNQGIDDQSCYFDDDVLGVEESLAEKELRQEKIHGAQERKKQVLHACQILAFDGEQAHDLAAKLKESLKHQLARCTICVREYHRGRNDLKHVLEEQFDTDVVANFMQRFDQMNTERITAGLDSIVETLIDRAPAERSIAVLPMNEMYALFESMHCTAFLRNEDLLRNHFDKPFRLVQTNKKISMPEYTPALTSFLFSYETERFAWALRGWKRFKRTITGSEFDWTVRDTLTSAMGRVNIVALEKDFLPVFWRATRTIVEKLDKNLITHHLRALDIDLCKLALDHMQLDFDGYQDLVATLRYILETAPGDVWDALAAISPQMVAEQIFNSPSFERSMMNIREDQSSQLDLILAWIDPFISSIKATNLAPACRALSHQLMTRLQADRFSRYARTICWQKGLQVIVKTLQIMDQTSAGGATVADLLELVKTHVFTILDNLHRFKDSPSHARETELGLDIIRSALSLDCHSLTSLREDILQGKSPGHDINISSLAIWKAAVRSVTRGDITLASAILIGTRRLVFLEPLTYKQSARSPKLAEAWNNGYNRASTYVSELLERLQDFDATELVELIKSSNASHAFYAAVFSGHGEIQQAAATIVKAMSSEDSRRDGIRYLIEKFFTISLTSISYTLQTIARARLFAPCKTVLKLGTDVLDSLCNAQSGILRSKTFSEEDGRATERVWQSLWMTIGVMFEHTESWALSGQDKNEMMEFCRDAMDFAGSAFDQYSVIAGALRQINPVSEDKPSEDLDRRLLQTPLAASGHVTKWLRLRDEYLVEKAVTITCLIMGRLQDANLQLPEESTVFVDDILANQVKTKLSFGQKAKLRRALDEHLGSDPSELSGSDAQPEVRKPQKQGSLNSWVTPGASAVSSPVSSTDKSKRGIDFDSWRSAAQQRRDDKSSNDASLKKTISSASPTMEMLKARGDFSNRGGATIGAQAPRLSANDFRRKRQEEQEAMRKQKLAFIAAAKKNEAGSGLAGIGVEGKDHSAKGQGVMVSSDESSDDEDGGLDADLFGLSAKPKRNDTVRRDAAGAIGLKPEQRGPVKLQRQIRSAKDMRARLAPDLSPLHKIILGWDFFHTGEYPPNSNDWQFRKVANSFRHVGDYQDTFRPLLTLEAWQGFAKSREENTFKPFGIKIVNRSSVDAFVEISSAISHADNREISINESDIILFSKAENPTSDNEAPHCLARVYRTRRQKAHIEIIYRVMPGTSIVSSLTPGTVIFGTKIQSITPLEREYGALLGLQYYDLCDEIIKAKPSPLLNYTDRQMEPIVNNYTLNMAQAKAVRSAVDNDAFTLIQGPPGSGKTKTIVAIVGALLSDSLVDKQVGITRIEVPKANTVSQPTTSAVSKKLLVCAPSNAAVDELVMRFKEGIKTLKGVHKKINIVRLGRSDAINSNVTDVTMDELVNKRLGPVNGDNEARTKTQTIMKEHQAVSQQLNLTRARLDSGEVKGKEASELQDEFNALRRRKTQLGTQIDNAKDDENRAGRSAEVNRKRVQQAVLDEAHVICATLSGSGHDMFQSLNIEFETVVVDEAAQCVEMSALIPLKYGCAKCILVGDPRQLPPTVFSKAASANKYEQSLFVRMQNNHPNAVHLLDTQYRMHPDISAFPSATFYEGRLLDGDNMATLREQPWHSSEILAPYRFFDVQGQHQVSKGHSLINLAEIEIAMALYERLTRDYSDYDFNNKIGIITPYKSQLRELKLRFANRYGDHILQSVEFNTTDAFQGRESEVIIFSCVRASPAGSVGFLSDIRRMNVGITRAKSSLWILGNSQSLMRGEYWSKLIVDAQERDSYSTGDVSAMLRKHSSTYPAKPRSSVRKVNKSATEYNHANGHSRKNETSRAEKRIRSPSGSGNSDDSADRAKKSVKKEPLSDTMEGVRVKIEDKLAGIRARTGAEVKVKDEDVEMRDADVSSGGESSIRRAVTKVAQTERVKPETPASEEDKKSLASGGSTPRLADQSAPGQASGKAPPPGRAPPPVIRKRRPADPFMPASNRSKQPRKN
ncbi:hypothetical protein MBLNU459_g1824t4 [Dothideomycetes sp. NU459]